MAEVMTESGDFDEDGAYAGLTVATIPDEEMFICPTYDDVQFPDWPDRVMLDWLPSSIFFGYGDEESGTPASTVYRIHDIEGLVDGLRSVGATCERDDSLIAAASLGR